MPLDQTSTIQKAVIYCRVSSKKQVKDGHGLDSQETRCREYAKYKSFSVVEVFRDDISGKHSARPGMGEMLAFLRKHRKRDPHIVIIDDISRLARDIEAHLKLRADIGGAGGILQSPSIEFGDDSDSILVENLLASVSQHQRQKNAEQTHNRMRARAMSGYWVFPPPPGYRFEKKEGHGKVLVRAEPVATVIEEALKGYASGRFSTQSAVKQFLDHQPAFPKDRTGTVHLERVKELLTRPLYAGYVDIPNWNIRLQKGKHEGLIDYKTFDVIQEQLAGTAKVPFRKDLSSDFPLRGFVSCSECGEPLTACWSKGRSARYPYYLCDTKDCSLSRKSIRKEEIEGAFETLLKSLRPAPRLHALAFDIFRDLWNEQHGSAHQVMKDAQAKLTVIERKIGQLVDRLMDTDSQELVAEYEKRMKGLVAEKTLIDEKLASPAKPKGSFEQIYRTAFEFLANPYKLWASERLEDKHAVLKLVFADRLTYAKNQGYRTAKTTLPFKVLGGLSAGKGIMVPPVGIEPTLPKGTGF